jgi:threonyl-tRNA synthetase
MYTKMELDDAEYRLKPMNCPGHILIYKNSPKSYRDLPVRLAELGNVYRYERSGTMHGLLRVRGFTQDDAHIFCTREQMMGELISLLDFTLGLLRDFGLTDFYLELSTRPEHKAVGTIEEWDSATDALRLAAAGRDLELVLDEGGGAFYGPKISVQARDAIGRTWQMSTIQVDFQFPQRFDLHFVDDSGVEQRPIMIHRALFGSIERFFGILLEHYAGHFPLWLAPVQVAIVPVQDDSEEVMASIRGLEAAMRTQGLRVSVDDRHGERMQARVRDAELKRIPYVVVIGKRDVERGDGVVRVRDVRRNSQDDVPTGELVERLVAEVSERRPE